MLNSSNTITALDFAFNGIISKNDLTECNNYTKYNNFQSGEHLESYEILLILDGSAYAFNSRNEIVKTYYAGFIGLHNLFTTQNWLDYKFICNTETLCLSINSDFLIRLIDSYPRLYNYFHYQLTELDLLLLHFEATSENLANRLNLSQYLSNLTQVIIEAGNLVSGECIRKNKFVILYSGDLLHDSGIALSPGRVYSCSKLPKKGEWFSLDRSLLFVY